jgi:hypothetical protein
VVNIAQEQEVRERVEQAVVAMGAQGPLVLLQGSIPAVVVAAVAVTGEHGVAVTAALALLSLKCLTMLAQFFLAALHPACPHPVGSTSTL